MVDVSLPCGDLDDPVYFGILVPAPSGVRYQVQCGGVICHQAALEGVYLPLLSGDLGEFEADPNNRGAGPLSHFLSLPARDKSRVWKESLALLPEGFFRAATENEIVEFLRDNPEADYSGEAWLPLVVASRLPTRSNLGDILAGFAGRMVVIVWGNSD